MQKLNGPFKDIIPLLVKMKKSNGYKYFNIYSYVELDNFLFKNNILELNDLNIIYTLAIKNEKNEYLKIRRYSALENINAIMHAMGMQEIKMEKLILKSKEKFVARILDIHEAKILFNTIDALSVRMKKKDKLLYQTIYRLIYSTGLRINEVLSLEKADYSRENGALLIKKSKNNITRNVCLSNSMQKIFNTYFDSLEYTNSNKIFNISETKIRNFFSYAIISSSLEPCRIHDLRHTFAVNALNKLLKENEEYKALYYLQIFMGHSSIKSTEYYLSLTREQQKKLREKEEKIDEYIFGGITNGNK